MSENSLDVLDDIDKFLDEDQRFTHRLIYVFGTARGGTTFLKNIVGLHPGLVSFDGPTHFLNHVWRHRKRLLDRLWRGVFWMPFRAEQSAIRSRLPAEQGQKLRRSVNQALSSHQLGRIYRQYPLIRALSPDSGIDPAAMVGWLDKGNDCWGIDALASAFPEAKFIAIVRDPRAAIASLSGRVAGARAGAFDAVNLQDIVTSTIYWCRIAQQQLRFAKRHPGMSLILRYEDMVQAPQEMTTALYSALGLPPVPAEELTARLKGITYGASLDSKECGEGVNTRPLNRWKDTLDAASMSLIAEICGPTAQRLGYDLTQHRADRGLWRIARLMPTTRGRMLTMLKLIYLRARSAPAVAVFKG